MSDSTPAVTLTDPQRRHLSVLLAQVEDAVLSLERLADEPSCGGRLRLDRLDLPPGFGPASRSDLEQVRDGVAALARSLALAPLVRSRSQEALGLLTIAIVQLEDARSHGMRGYGPVDPHLPALLDPALGRLRERLARVAARLEQRKRTTTEELP